MRTPASRVAVVTTGGTIVSRIEPATGLAMPVMSGAALLECIADRVDIDAIEVLDLMCVASPHITPEHWLALQRAVAELVARSDIAGVVVTHGTSTLEETAWFLDVTLDTGKPVVLTGAQRNASEPDFDGPRNLLNAIRICRCPEARGMGVLVALNDHINAAREVRKTHTLDVETFQSGEWGFVGAVAGERVVFHRRPMRPLYVPLTGDGLPEVDIVSMYAGARGRLVDAAVNTGAQGLVIQAVASGHVNGAMFDAIVRARARDVPVVIATRIPNGGTRIGYGFAGSTRQLVDAGAVLSGDLSAWKARILLMLAIQAGLSGVEALRELFDTGIAARDDDLGKTPT
ncbi:asparaginase [Alcaligenaceae bacterium C4P045]|nr:asparaginase [Alcaligenaceae bacterium C4P045]